MKLVYTLSWLDSRTVSKASCQANTSVTVESHVMAKTLVSFRLVLTWLC